MPMVDPRVLDQLPWDAPVYISLFTVGTAFHIWRNCRSLRWKTTEVTIAEARRLGLGVCSYCADRARRRSG